MNAIHIFLLVVASSIVGIPTLVVFLNNRKLKALQAKKEQQNIKTQKALVEAKAAEESYSPYEDSVQILERRRQRKNELAYHISNLESRIAIVVTEKEFSAMNLKISSLKEELEASLKQEAILFKQAKPIMDRIETERCRQEEAERQARLKREEAERKARKKREEEEEEERRARRRRDDAAAASYSSSSSWSSSSDSGSSWSGGGGDSSGGGSSDSW